MDLNNEEVDKENEYDENILSDNIIYNENNSFGNNKNSFFNNTSPLKTEIINEEENSLNEMKEDINEYVEMENKLDTEKIKDSEKIGGKIEVDNKMISPINRHNFYLTILEGMNKNFPRQWNKNNITLSKNQGQIYKGRKEKKRKRSYRNDEKLLDHSILNDINISDKMDERNELLESIKSNSTINNVLEIIKYDNRKKIKKNDTNKEIIKYDNFTSKYNNKSNDIQLNGGIYINKFKLSLDMPINKLAVSSKDVCHNNNVEDHVNYDNEELNKKMDEMKEEKEERNEDRGIYDELLENDMCDLYNLKMHDLHNLKSYDFGLSKDLLKKDIFIYSNNLKNDDMDDDDNNNMNDIAIGENVIYENDIHENNIDDNDMYNNYVNGNDLYINNMQDDAMDDIVYDEEEIKSFLDKLKSDISNQMNVKNGNVEVTGNGGNEEMSYINNDENLQAFDLLDNFHMDDYGNNYNDNEEDGDGDGDDDEQKKRKQKELHNVNGKLNLSDLNEL
ncbi:hypothetical protein PFMALIP_02909, partial [Plasmodium falciparum MaliPS096_E11]